MHKKLLGVGLLTIVLVGVAWKVSVEKAPQTEVTRSTLYPGLIDKLNEVARIELRSAKTRTTLKRDGEHWTVANRDGFPADATAIKRSMLQLADLQIVEAKTRLADSYGRIGVADPGEGSDSLQIEAYGAKDDKVLALIVGHPRDSAHRFQHYVRRVGEPQSWLVNGKLEAASDPITWLDSRIVDIDTARVRRVEIVPDQGAPLVIEKDKPSNSFFDLKNLPSGKVPRSKALVSSLGALLLDLRFNSVVAGARFAEAKPIRRTTVQTFDGLVAHIDEFEDQGKRYARFDFAYDASLVQTPPAVASTDATAPAAASAEAGVAPAPLTTDGAPAAAALAVPKESVEQQAARLKASTANWVYELPDYKMRMLAKRLDDLIQAPSKGQGPSENKGPPEAQP